jgi:hypothetical protein
MPIDWKDSVALPNVGSVDTLISLPVLFLIWRFWQREKNDAELLSGLVFANDMVFAIADAVFKRDIPKSMLRNLGKSRRTENEDAGKR